MKELFLITPAKLVDMHEAFNSLEDVRAKYQPHAYICWEETDKFCVKVITIHNERDTMKGRNRDGWCY